MTRNEILERYLDASRKKDYTWDTYQPLNIPGYEATLTQGGRKCSDRANAIREHALTIFEPGASVVDWGCNNGFFTFEMAKAGYRAVGIDRDSRLVERCRFLTPQGVWAIAPEFHEESLHSNAVKKHPADIGMCFSVLHHLKADKREITDAFASEYRHAYIEMDGNNFGYDWLRVFYFGLWEVCEANDPYGKGTRKRKTWYCCNESCNYIYRNLKPINCLSGRAVFHMQHKSGGKDLVMKRENLSFEHTWLKSNIGYEAEVYRRFPSPFLPEIVSYMETSVERVLMTEFLTETSDKGAPLESIFAWLKDNNLRIIDFHPSQFVRTKAGFVLVDAESVIPESELDSRLKKKDARLKTPEEQAAALRRHFKM